jgi:hypothetical protein
MSEMIERVARAAYEVLMTDETIDAWVDKDPADMSSVVVDGSINLLSIARAAIAAMREPTKAMAEAGGREVPGAGRDGPVGDYGRFVWRPMIDAALKP